MTLTGVRGWAVLGPFRHRNFRLFFAGQTVSQIGTWMQTLGQAWLVLQLTHSAFLLGVVSALQWGPLLLLSLPAGVLADRVSRRRLLIGTQTLFLLLALCLGILSVAGLVRYWHVAVLAVLFGIVNAFDVPARQAFVVEMVGGSEDLSSAVALNTALFAGSRLIGPGVGGLTIAAWGVGAAFLANAASFLAVIVALCAMREPPRQPVASWTSLLDRIGEGMQFVERAPLILWTLVMLAVVSLFATNNNIFIPMLATARLGLGASGFGWLTAANGAGAVLGGLLVAVQGRALPRRVYLSWSAVLLCATTMGLSLAMRVDVAAVLLFLTGGEMVVFSAVANGTIQFDTPDALRGRVMSIYSLVWNGTSPFGALLVGGIIGAWGLSAGLLVGGGAGLAGTAVIHAFLLRRRLQLAPSPRASQDSGPT